MKNKYFLFWFFAVLSVFLHSCALFDDLEIKADRKTFIMERSLWDSQNIKDYEFTYDYFDDAGPIGPAKITVKENEAPIIDSSDRYYYSFVESIPEIYDYINETFNFIETVENGTYSGHKIRSITLKITYDTQYHYPTSADLSTGYVESVDGGAYYTLRVTEFKPLGSNIRPTQTFPANIHSQYFHLSPP